MGGSPRLALREKPTVEGAGTEMWSRQSCLRSVLSSSRSRRQGHSGWVSVPECRAAIGASLLGFRRLSASLDVSLLPACDNDHDET